MRRVVTVAAIVVAAMVGPAGPAVADPAGPTHYRATVTGVSAADGGAVPVEVEILGGDAFLVVRAEPGALVEIPGYDGEPYVRIEPDGSVRVNELAPAWWMNQARYATSHADMPQHADAEAPPQWALAGRAGEYAWHDHRVHFMSPELPPEVDPDDGTVQPVWDWDVPMVVDGRDVTISGSLVWVPGPGPVVPWMVVAVLALVVVAVVVRRPAAAGLLALVGALAAGAVGVTRLVDVPAGVDAEPVLVVLPLITGVVLAIGAIVRRRGPSPAMLLVPASGIPLLIWGVLQSGALVRPIVPGPVPVGIVRAVVAFAVAIGIAGVVAAALAVRSGTSRERAAVSGSDDLN